MSAAIQIWMKSVEERIGKLHTFAECELGFRNEQWRFRCSLKHAGPSLSYDDEMLWEFFAPSLTEIMEKTNAWVDHPETVPPYVQRSDRYDQYGYDGDRQRREEARRLEVAIEKARYEMRAQAEVNVLARLYDEKRIEIERNFETDKLTVRRRGPLWD